MRSFPFLVAAVLAAAPGCSSSARPAVPAGDAAPSVFRWVRVHGGTITLGEPLPAAVAVARPGDSVVALPPGSFAGAEAIRVHLAADGRVRFVWFDYPQGTDFDAMVAGRVRSLGAPAERRRSGPAGGPPTDELFWRDAATELRLVRDPRRNAATVFAVLSDRRRAAPAEGGR